MAVILIGTSGYSYDDWRGRFYPAGLPKHRFLAFYAEHFPVCEINFTYYRPPDARTMDGMLRKSGGRVEMVVKAPAALTHERVDDPAPAARALVAALAPLQSAGVLGAVLLQFPFSFHETPTNRDHLRRMRDLLPDLPLVVEVRNSRWISEATFDLLRESRLAFCNVDEPRLEGLLPPLGVVTAAPGYVRFHGRNAARWWEHEHAYERYDYRYADGELREWLPRLAGMKKRAEKSYVFFNNHFDGQAIDGARALRRLLDSAAD
ncbi:MAG: DUF72 domain-containing protein [Deltaproteobacteria bacterium]|nr:DUF72 domain-containing protein [Deltaproteobacteria bacterium]